MTDPITKRFTNYSTPDSFSFGFHCDRCGAEWRSETWAFNAAGYDLPLDERIFGMIWSEQHDAAYERANYEARFMFSRCPVCSLRVRGDCFHVSRTGITDVCKVCLAMDTQARGR